MCANVITSISRRLSGLLVIVFFLLILEDFRGGRLRGTRKIKSPARGVSYLYHANIFGRNFVIDHENEKGGIRRQKKRGGNKKN